MGLERSLDPTYKELKQLPVLTVNMPVICCLDPTYKELKLHAPPYVPNSSNCLDPTYKELKLSPSSPKRLR